MSEQVNWGDVQESIDPAKEQLDELSTLCEQMLTAEAELKQAQDAVKLKQKELDRFTLNIIPEAMQSIGVNEIKLDSGYRMTVVEELKCHLSKDRKPAAIKWLDDNGHGGLLKTELKASFTREEKVQAEMLLSQINELTGGRFIMDANVHPSTLKAFIKRLKADGEPIDDELFGVYTFKTIKIKRVK